MFYNTDIFLSSARNTSGKPGGCTVGSLTKVWLTMEDKWDVKLYSLSYS